MSCVSRAAAGVEVAVPVRRTLAPRIVRWHSR